MVLTIDQTAIDLTLKLGQGRNRVPNLAGFGHFGRTETIGRSGPLFAV